MNRLVSVSLFLIALLIAGTAAEAQITINQTDMQSVLVNSKRMEYFMTYLPYPVVNLGSMSGSMQTFDFSALPTEESKDSASMNFVDPAGQPGASNFPTATLCSPIVIVPFPGAELTVVIYMRLQSDGFYQLGTYSRQLFPPFIDTTIVEKNSPMQILIPLPLTYGTSRTGVDTVVADPINNDYTVTTTDIACDGWGDITYPLVLAGEGAPKTVLVSCLRGTQTQVMENYSGGVFSSRDKEVSVFYISLDGTLFSVDQPDSNYAGGTAEVRSLNYSVRVGTSDVRQVSPAVPEGFALSQNYPNPFNPSTTITFAVPSTGHVSMNVYDLLGREIATLVDRQMSPGTYEASFDAEGLPSGMYIYRIVSGTYVETKKMNVVK
ncbi:MAG TPA: T9SS type A sorting domain-containing protein [Bacteroidota bacterium]|nr:T9SS type A sorting domain-containing protein [Bacteroidota bacterium]